MKNAVSAAPSCLHWQISTRKNMAKNPPASAGDIRGMGLILGLGRCPGGGRGTPPQHSCLETPMDRGAWRATVHGVARVGRDWRGAGQAFATTLQSWAVTAGPLLATLCFPWETSETWFASYDRCGYRVCRGSGDTGKERHLAEAH